jgi:hypothetical protein
MANIAYLDAFMLYLQNPRNSNGNFGVQNFILETSADNVVAYAAGGQANATAITSQTTRVTTVAAPNGSVQLPASVAGLEILVINHGSNPMQVFGINGSTDTINDAAAATGVSQMQNSIVVYTCATPGQWYSIGLGQGFVKGLPTSSTADNLVATGTTQATGLSLSSVINRVATTPAGSGIVLPVSAPGLSVVVMNAGANALLVYPAGADTVNVAGALTGGGVAYSLAAGHSVTFYCASTVNWHGILS